MKDIQPGYCQCGCGKRTKICTHAYRARGLVKGQPMRFCMGHAGPLARWGGITHYIVDETTGCWIWQRAQTHNGYGQSFNKRTKKGCAAHRVYYELKYGPIPAGKFIDHLCRVRLCVNPDHMELVTTAENVRRGLSTKLTAEKVQEIKALYLAGINQYQLAERFGVLQQQISRIVRGERWVAV